MNIIMIKAEDYLRKFRQGVGKRIAQKIRRQEGASFVEWMLILAVLVTVGGVILGLLNSFIPGFFNDWAAKARSTFGL